MAVLALVQAYPYDEVLGGDPAYMFALVEYLISQGHEVHGLVTDLSRGRANPVYRSSYPIEQLSSWRVRRAVRLGERTFFAPHPGQLARVLNKLTFNGLFAASKVDPPVGTWAPREACWVEQTLASLRPAAVLLVQGAIYLAPFLHGVGAKFALFGHVPAALTLSNWHQANSGNKDFDESRTSGAFKQELSSAMTNVDCVGLNNLEDLAYVRDDLGVQSTMMVGMGYAAPKSHPESEEPVVLFVGNATDPNTAALSWFTSKVWPLVLASLPSARFRVVGRAALAMGDQETPRIERVGPVDDVAPEYERAQLVVVPLTFGTAGVKIKVAEAMAHGRPLVTTSFGVDARDPHQFDECAIVADTAEDFARAVIALLRDPDLRKKKSAGARQVFEKRFSYEACYGDFMRWLDRIS